MSRKAEALIARCSSLIACFTCNNPELCLAMRTHFNLTAAEYEAQREGAVEERRRRLVRNEIDRLGGVSCAIELGCGPGRFLAELARDYPHITFTGIDINSGMIEHAQERHRLPNLRYELRDITANGGTSAELVFSIDVLHHVHDLERFCRAVRQRMPPDGVWLAVEPNVFHPYIYCSQERMRRAGFDEDHFRPWIAEPLFRQAGFAISSRRYASVFPGALGRLPRPLTWLERQLENWRFLGGSVVYRLQAASNEQRAMSNESQAEAPSFTHC